MSQRIVTITGSSGFLGRILRAGLRQRQYEVREFDQLRGPVVDTLRCRPFGTCSGRSVLKLAKRLHRTLGVTERLLLKTGMLRRSGDDILAPRSRLVERFRGSDAIIHLAALPHPHVPGATDDDFRRINYEGAINVFEAACAAGVGKFIFASSCQVYGISRPTRIDQFPILESNYLPTLSEGQNTYGHWKREFECYLERECRQQGNPQAVSLRLEFPGIRSTSPANFYISTSVENTVAGFVAALEMELPGRFDVFNLADAQVDARIANIQEFLRSSWPHVPNHTVGNECLLSTAKAIAGLGFRPQQDGTYFSSSVAF